jgi:MarR family transcriptional regulator for hemolysin
MQYNPNESTSALTKKIAGLFIRLSNQYLKKRGISHAYTPFLVQLWDEDGQTQAELHRKIGIDQPAAVRTLDRMERDQLISRIRSETDRRQVKIYLTPKAQQLRAEVISCATMINEVGTQGLSKAEKDVLHQLLKKVMSNLEVSLHKRLDNQV